MFKIARKPRISMPSTLSEHPDPNRSDSLSKSIAVPADDEAVIAEEESESPEENIFHSNLAPSIPVPSASSPGVSTAGLDQADKKKVVNLNQPWEPLDLPSSGSESSSTRVYKEYNYEGYETGQSEPNINGRSEQNESSIANSEYSRKCKELLELNRGLHNLGAGNLVQLPRVAVIGGQSAGKSSLVEAVSGINVPRDSGTCTRCPLECSLSRSADSWSCEIALQINFASDGKKLPSPERHQFSPRITEKESLELWLRRAQTAILCPHLTRNTFASMSQNQLLELHNTDENKLKFSKNIVSVTIQDPEATDLSFVDLPGLIQNESQDIIDIVKDLVVSNIEEERTLILIAIPISDDMENQQAVRLAREADASGKRTIGVLTKPDALQAGSTNARQKWKQVLQGEAYTTTLGYYCVRLPDDEERAKNLSRTERERNAANFFNETSPWKDIPDRRRFGIPNFVTDLSRLLVQLIENAIPKLRAEVNRLLKICEDEIAKLPSVVVSEPIAEILNRLTKFCTDLNTVIKGEGSSANMAFVQASRTRYKEFKANLRKTTPHFRTSNDAVSPLSEIGEFERPTEVAWGPSQTRYKRSKANLRNPASNFRTSNDDVPSDTDDFERSPEVIPLGVSEVREVIAKSIGWELPFNVPFEAKKLLIQKHVQLWKSPTERCLHDTARALEQELHRLLEENFGRFKRLKAYLKSLTALEFEKCKIFAEGELVRTLELEQGPVWTQNFSYLKTERSKWIQHFSLNEENTEETLVMAEVRAYFQLAYERAADMIPLSIEHSLNQRFAFGLQEKIVPKILGEQDTPGKLRSLVQEDPSIAARRDELTEKRERLMEIKRRLDDFSS